MDIANSNNGELTADSGWSTVEIQLGDALAYLTPRSSVYGPTVAKGLPTRSDAQCRKRYDQIQASRSKKKNGPSNAEKRRAEIVAKQRLVQSNPAWKAFYKVKVKLYTRQLYETFKPSSEVADSFLSKMRANIQEEEEILAEALGESFNEDYGTLDNEELAVDKGVIYDETVSVTEAQVRRNENIVVVNDSNQRNNKAISNVLIEMENDGSWQRMDQSRRSGAIEVSSSFPGTHLSSPLLFFSTYLTLLLPCNRFYQTV